MRENRAPAVLQADPPGIEELRQRAATLVRESRWAEAELLYRDLFRQELLGHGDTACAVDAVRHQAIACSHQNRMEEAEELATLSWVVAERCDYMRGAARAVNVLAVTHYSRGDLIRAAKLYQIAQRMALDVGDDELIGFACRNLGIIANIQGDLREARTLYLEAIASAVRSGDAASAAGVYNNLGIVCTDLGEWMEAELYFDRGIEIAEQVGDLGVQALLHANRARPLIQVREFAAARLSLAAAAAIAERIGDAGTLSEVAARRGIIARMEGDLTTAAEHFEHALALSTDPSLAREHALAVEEVARLRRDEERQAEALSLLEQARETFVSLGSQRDVARVEELLAEWTAAPAASVAGG